MPLYATQATFTLAECHIAELENGAKNANGMHDAEALLGKIDPKPNDPFGELPDMASWLQLARARIELLRHNRAKAAKFAALAAPVLASKDADSYEKAALERVQEIAAESRLNRSSQVK
jgi:hypothetical protein